MTGRARANLAFSPWGWRKSHSKEVLKFKNTPSHLGHERGSPRKAVLQLNGVSDRRSLTFRYHREGETKEESPFEDYQRLIGEHTEENQQ